MQINVIQSERGYKKIPLQLFNPSLILIVLFSVLLFTSCKQSGQKSEKFSGYAIFNWFEYTGNDPVFSNPGDQENQYTNPVLAGF